jgi:hypothetical protein
MTTRRVLAGFGRAHEEFEGGTQLADLLNGLLWPRQTMEVSVPAGDSIQLFLDEIDARNRIDAPVSPLAVVTAATRRQMPP